MPISFLLTNKFHALKEHKHFEIIFLISMLILKACDLPSIIFNNDYAREYHIFKSMEIEKFNKNWLKLVYSICDILVYFKLKNKEYILLSLLIPATISSLENLILIYDIEDLHPVLSIIDPIYFYILPGKVNSLSLFSTMELVTSNNNGILNELNTTHPSIPSYNTDTGSIPANTQIFILFTKLPIYSRLPDSLKEFSLILFSALYFLYNFTYQHLKHYFHFIYEIGYSTSHLPSLSGFWYLFMCMIEQYTFFSYSMHLVNAKLLISKEKRLLPIFKNNSNLISYLPFILKSEFSSLFCIAALVFEYLFMIFKKWEVANTNFLCWFTFIFIGLYIYELKQKRICNRK